MTRWSPWAGALIALVACRKGTMTATGADSGGDSATLAAVPLAAPLVVAARCHATNKAVAIEPHDDALEIGDAVASARAIGIGVIHRTSAGRVAAVAMLPLDASAVQVVDLGPTLGDAPPPRVAWHGKDLVAAAYALVRSTGRPDVSRELAVHVLGPDGDDRLLPAIKEQRDDSLAFDVAWGEGGGVAVWDEDTAGPKPRGVIRVAPLGEEARAAGLRDVSPPESDAEMPRVVAGGRGFFVVWIARRPEAPSSVDGSAGVEATGEARAYAWLEMVALDGRGVPLGPARRLTSPTGHVAAYDVQMLSGEAKPTMLVVARDDGEAVDGSGGVLVRVRAREDGAEPALALPGDGLGRGAPTLVDASSPWLAWVGPHEELRLLPLDASGAPVASPSAEHGLDDARPLLVLGSPDLAMLVATPGDPAAQLRVFGCRADAGTK